MEGLMLPAVEWHQPTDQENMCTSLADSPSSKEEWHTKYQQDTNREDIHEHPNALLLLKAGIKHLQPQVTILQASLFESLHRQQHQQ